ncbi:Golgi apyrase, partial [Physocladia obscura]
MQIDWAVIGWLVRLVGDFFGERAQRQWYEGRQFGLVVDAGSSGTRLAVYSWRLDVGGGTGLVRIERAFAGAPHDASLRAVVPGLSSLAAVCSAAAANATDANAADACFGAVAAHLAPLLEFARAAVPAALHATTPFFLLATAGLRLASRDTQRRMLAAVSAAVRQNSVFAVRDVRVIDGDEEGLYGWLAVNYLTKALSQSNGGRSFGFMDMGGASTQFAFVPTKEDLDGHLASSTSDYNDNSLHTVQLKTLDGAVLSYTVFVSSFLGFGVNEARRRYVHGLAQDWGLLDDDHSENPADSLINRDKSILIQDILNTTSTTTTTTTTTTSATLHQQQEETAVHIFDPCLPENLILKSDTHIQKILATSSNYTQKFHLIGTGSLPQCLASLHPYLRKSLPCQPAHQKQQPSCLFAGISAPLTDFSQHRFIGVSEYYYTPATFVPNKMSAEGGPVAYNFGAFVKNAEQRCATTYDRIWTTHVLQHGLVAAGSVEEERMQMQCFKSAWVLEVLHDGFGIPRDLQKQHFDGSGGQESGKSGSDHGKSNSGLGGATFESLNEIDGFK